jgi:NifU-like protein involved in Fe-S cluster formation
MTEQEMLAKVAEIRERRAKALEAVAFAEQKKDEYHAAWNAAKDAVRQLEQEQNLMWHEIAPEDEALSPFKWGLGKPS